MIIDLICSDLKIGQYLPAFQNKIVFKIFENFDTFWLQEALNLNGYRTFSGDLAKVLKDQDIINPLPGTK